MRISDWSSDVCSSDLLHTGIVENDHRNGQRTLVEIGRLAFDKIAHALCGPVLFLPIRRLRQRGAKSKVRRRSSANRAGGPDDRRVRTGRGGAGWRSEEHTYEIQSLMRNTNAVLSLT